MRFLQINDVSQQLNVQGHWYLLDSQDYEITPARLNFPGMMRFQADGDARLSIIGSCGADYTLRRKRVPVVVGRCCSQTGTPKEKCFDGWASIFDAWGGSFGNITCPAVMKSDFAFSDVWLGPSPLCQKSDACFDSVNFGINNLEHLLFSNHFRSNWEPSAKKLSIECTLPKDLILFENSDVRISISFICDGGSWTLVQLDSALHEHVRVEIEALKGPIKFYGKTNSYEYYVNAISSLLGLMIFNRAYIFDVRGEKKKKDNSPQWFCRRWRRTIPQSSAGTRAYLKCLFPIVSENQNCRGIVEEYIRKYDSIKRDVDTIIQLKHGTQTLTIKSLADLLFAFEGLSNHLCKAENAAYVESLRDNEDHKKIRDDILSRCTAEQVKWIGHKLDISATFAVKLRVAAQLLKPFFAILGDDKLTDKLISYYRDSRNGTAHSLSHTDLNVDFYVSSIEWLAMFMVSLILKRLSLDDEMLRGCLKAWEHTLSELEETIKDGLLDHSSK